MPDTAEQAVELAEMGALASPLAITVRRKPGGYDQIVAHRLGPRPPRMDSEDGLPELAAISADEVPF